QQMVEMIQRIDYFYKQLFEATEEVDTGYAWLMMFVEYRKNQKGKRQRTPNAQEFEAHVGKVRGHILSALELRIRGDTHVSPMLETLLTPVDTKQPGYKSEASYQNMMEFLDRLHWSTRDAKESKNAARDADQDVIMTAELAPSRPESVFPKGWVLSEQQMKQLAAVCFEALEEHKDALRIAVDTFLETNRSAMAAGALMGTIDAVNGMEVTNFLLGARRGQLINAQTFEDVQHELEEMLLATEPQLLTRLMREGELFQKSLQRKYSKP